SLISEPRTLRQSLILSGDRPFGMPIRDASISRRAQRSRVSNAMKAFERLPAPATAPWFSSMTVLHPRAKTRAIFSPRSSLPGNPYSAMPTSPYTDGASGIREISGSFRTKLNAISAEHVRHGSRRRVGVDDGPQVGSALV